MAKTATKTKRYSTDLTDEKWDLNQSFLPKVTRRGRKPRTDLRAVLDACAYCDFVLDIVRRSDHEPGFKILLRRRVVEGPSSAG